MLKVFKSEIVKFILRNERMLTQLIARNRLDLIKIIYSETNAFLKIDCFLDEAASEGLIEVVIYLSEMGASCSTTAMENAARFGHFDVVRWLHFNRSEVCTTNAMDLAASNGHLDVVKLFHLNRTEGCTTDAIDNAASNGHLEIVKWLHRNRSEGCDRALVNAARHFHLSVVEYLVENSLGVDRIQEAIDYSLPFVTREELVKIQEIKKYLRSL